MGLGLEREIKKLLEESVESPESDGEKREPFIGKFGEASEVELNLAFAIPKLEEKRNVDVEAMEEADAEAIGRAFEGWEVVDRDDAFATGSEHAESNPADIVGAAGDLFNKGHWKERERLAIEKQDAARAEEVEAEEDAYAYEEVEGGYVQPVEEMEEVDHEAQWGAMPESPQPTAADVSERLQSYEDDE